MDNEEDEELFNKGDMIVLVLKDGRHYLGEFLWCTDEGCALEVTAKTAFRIEKLEDSKFQQFVDGRIKEELGRLFTPTDWVAKALELNTEMNREHVYTMDLGHLKEIVIDMIRAKNTAWARQNWTGYIQEQDVSVPYMKYLRRSVRTLVLWHKIDEVCSASEMAEEAQIANWENLVNNEDFFKLLVEKDENDRKN